MNANFRRVREVVLLYFVHLLVVQKFDVAAVGDVGVGEYGLVDVGTVRVAERNAGKSVNLRIHERIVVVSVAGPVVVRSKEPEVVAEGDILVNLELQLAPEVVLVILVRTHAEGAFLVLVAAGEVVIEVLRTSGN